jgi:hypothetical protein
LSGTSGRHGSHAKPKRLSTTKARVTTAAAVTGVVVLGGGIAGAAEARQHNHNSQEAADSDAARFADAKASQDLAARAAAGNVANRSAVRPPLVAASPTDPQQVELLVTNPGAAPTPTAGTPTPTPSVPLPSSTPSSTQTSTFPFRTPPAPSTSTAKPSTSASTTPKPTTSAPSAGYNATPAQARAIAQQLVPSGQFQCFDDIITRESSWNLHATNASSGAYGLGQALPGSKMATVASDWRTNAVTQIKWALSYMDGRYGSPCSAWSFWQVHDWY